MLLREVKKTQKGNDEYFLVTPVEKVKIKVDDAPFVLTQWHWLNDDKESMVVNTNVGDTFILDAEHPIISSENGELYVLVRRNLLAKIHRNVYYQWADLAKGQVTKKGTELVFSSANCQFSLGVIS